MSARDDSLDGYRQEEMGDYTSQEQEVIDILQDDRMLFDLIGIGLDMQKFIRTPAGKALWDGKVSELSRDIQIWLSAADPTERHVCVAHTDARVALGVLHAFQKAIDSGREAQEQLRIKTEEEGDGEYIR